MYGMQIAMLEHYQRYMPKLTNIAELKVCFVDDSLQNDMPQEFIFTTDLDCVLLQLVDIRSEHCLNDYAKFAADIPH